MRQTLKSQKANAQYEEDACILLESQKNCANALQESHAKVAVALDAHQKQKATNLLDARNGGKKTVEELNQHAATSLASSHVKAAAMLKDTQLKAATALKESQAHAASTLQKVHADAAEKHQEKDDIISWMSGSYSVHNNTAG